MAAPRRPAQRRSAPRRPAAEAEDRSACRPCRGTGQVISGLGGTPSPVTCPWCGGSGRFQPGFDAQGSARSD